MKVKKVVTYTGISLVVIIAVLLILPFVINLDTYIPQITSSASKAIGRQVSISHLRLTILSGLGVELKGVTVQEKVPAKAPFISVKDISVGVNLLPLLKKEISVSKVVLDKPDINIIRYANGTYNFSDLLQKPAPQKPEQSTQAKPAASSGIPAGFSLDKLEIADGTVTMTDSGHGKQKQYGLNHINLGVYGFNVRKAFRVSLGVSFNNLKDARLDVHGDVGPTGRQISVEHLPLNLTILLKHIDIPYVMALAGVKGQPLSAGTLDVDERLSSKPSGSMDIKGKIQLAGLALTNGTISPFSITNALQFVPAEKVLAIEDVTLKSDGINIGLTGKTNIATKAIDIKMASRELSLEKLMAFYSPLENALPPSAQISGDAGITTTVRTSGAVMAVNGIIDLARAKIQYGTTFVKPDGIPLSLSYDIAQRKTTLDIKNIRLILDKLALNAAGTVFTSGDMNASITLATNSVPLQSLEDVIPLVKSYHAAGSFVLTASAKGALKKPKQLAVQGRLQVNNVSASISSLPKPLRTFDMDTLFTRNSVTIKSLFVQIGKSEVHGNGTIEDFSAPRGRLTLTSPYLNVDELMPPSKTGAKQETTQPAPAVAGTQQAQPSLVDTADITVSARVQKGIVRKAQFTDLVLLARLVKGTLFLNTFDVRAFSGLIAANGTVGISGQQPYNLKLRTSGLNLGDMLNTMTTYKDVMTGRLGSDIALNGNAKDLKKSVSGKGVMTVTDGEIKTFSLLSKLTSIANLINVGSGGTTKIQTMRMTAVIDHGKVTTNDLKLNSNDCTVTAQGYFDLDSNLNYHGTGILSRSISGRVGGTAGQLIKNQQGEVEIPFILTGDIRRPAFSLDAQAYQQRLKEAAKKQVIQQLNQQLNKELKTNKSIQQIQQNKNLQQMENQGKKAIQQLFH